MSEHLIVGPPQADGIPARVREMIEQPGIYLGSNPEIPAATVPLVSLGGRIFAVRIDHELDPRRFITGHLLEGPYRAGDTTKGVDRTEGAR